MTRYFFVVSAKIADVFLDRSVGGYATARALSYARHTTVAKRSRLYDRIGLKLKLGDDYTNAYAGAVFGSQKHFRISYLAKSAQKSCNTQTDHYVGAALPGATGLEQFSRR